MSFHVNVVNGEGDDDNCANDDGLDVYEAGVPVLKKKRKKKRPTLDHSIDGFSHPGPCKCNQTATTASLTSNGTRKSRHSFKLTLITSTL